MKKTKAIIALCIIATTAAFIYHFFPIRKLDRIEAVRTDTVEITRVDTVTIERVITKTKPVPVRTDTIYLTDTVETPHISKTYEIDTLFTDSLATIQSSLYIRTDNYDVDSISQQFKIDYLSTDRERTIERIVERKNRLNWGLQLGVGYGIINRKPDVYAGIGFQYNF